MPDRLIAIDLGAESGRVVVGTLTADRLDLDVVHRFRNGARQVAGAWRWDVRALWQGIRDGLARAAAGGPVAAIGVDTWGVDYALVDAVGELVEDPVSHRDPRTAGVLDQVHARLPAAAIYARNGVPPLAINTLYQLVAHQRDAPAALARAARLLMIPDLFHFWLSGELANERTDAGTSQLTVAGAARWDVELIGRLGLPAGLFGPIRDPGTRLGRLRPQLCRELGFASAPWIVLPAAHDTASAVAASPGDPDTTAYVSSGTWSLMGCVLDAPLLDASALAGGLSNEIAADGRIRLNKNIMGLWLVQELRRDLAAAGRERSYAELANLAAAAPASCRPLAVDDQRFLAPASDSDRMLDRVHAWCREHSEAPPADDGALMRLVFDGLAVAYARCLADLERVTGRRFTAVHVIGGGSQNGVLNQLTADACARPVIAGPAEATALGNLLVQAVGAGLLPSLAAGRALIARAVPLTRHEPGRALGASA